MTSESPTPNAEEGTTSLPFEKLPKLNLPPKPVLASSVLGNQEKTSTPASSIAPPAKPLLLEEELPPLLLEEALPPLLLEEESPHLLLEESTELLLPPPSKKKSALTLPLALIAIIAALLALMMQLFIFLRLL